MAKHNFSNLEIAGLLESVATALTLKKANPFEIRAYNNASTSIEHSTADVKDLWEEGKLDQIPGVGKSIAEHLDELFRTGKVAHFESLLNKFPDVVFDLIKIPGVGPKTALELAELGIKSNKELEEQIKDGSLVKKGFSAKVAEKIILSIQTLPNIHTGRMLLPVAFEYAEKILEYMKKNKDVVRIEPLGSLRRRVVTIGDLDFAACSDNPKSVIDHFVKMPGVTQIIEQGEDRAMVMLNSGIHVDLLVGKVESFGAMLQHFTGSKEHNITLRTLALKKGYSLSEDGIKRVKGKGSSGKLIKTRTEEEFYKILGMQTPAPEIREDTGEIQVAIKHELPQLIEEKDLKGDFHLHSNFPMSPSHGPGANSLEEIVKKAEKLGYKYLGISDHSPGFNKNSKEKIKKLIVTRTRKIEQLKSSSTHIRVLNGLEIDILPDGSLSVPDEALQTLDYCIAGVHSSHQMPKDKMTERILKALSNPYVRVLAHPTGRLLNKRDSYDADWEKIFKFCAENKKLLEIDAYPNRLDLRDDLVREALKYGVKFIIDSDAHAVEQMDNLKYGVYLARRGWVRKEDVVNTWSWSDLKQWFGIK